MAIGGLGRESQGSYEFSQTSPKSVAQNKKESVLSRHAIPILDPNTAKVANITLTKNSFLSSLKNLTSKKFVRITTRDPITNKITQYYAQTKEISRALGKDPKDVAKLAREGKLEEAIEKSNYTAVANRIKQFVNDPRVQTQIKQLLQSPRKIEKVVQDLTTGLSYESFKTLVDKELTPDLLESIKENYHLNTAQKAALERLSPLVPLANIEKLLKREADKDKDKANKILNTFYAADSKLTHIHDFTPIKWQPPGGNISGEATSNNYKFNIGANGDFTIYIGNPEIDVTNLDRDSLSDRNISQL